MKSYYVFIRNFGQMHPGSFVYYVTVGRSDREIIKLSLVQEYCRDCGFYFHIRNTQSLLAITQAKAQFGSGLMTCKNPFKVAQVTISDLYSMLIDDTLDIFEANFVSSPAAIRMNHYDDPKWIISFNRKQCNTTCQPHRRKNLSHSEQDDRRFVAIAVSIILVAMCAHTVFKQVCLNLFGAI